MTAGEPIVVRHRRSWAQRLVIAFNLLVVVSSLVTAGALAYVYRHVREIPRVELGGVLSSRAPGPDRAQNYLVVGTDSGEGLDPRDPVLIGRDNELRSDTIMVLRLDPAAEQAALLSLPRDLWLPIAGTDGSQRINTAIQGGPERLVATVSEAFNIPIHHYLQIDFLGFRDLVDTIDGVPVYFPDPVRDTRSGLEVPRAGCVTLDPVQALAYARSRAYEVYRDGRWRYDGTGDLGRISRQQDFIRRALRRAIDRGARNPSVLNDLIETGVDSVTIDADLSASDLIEIGRRFRGFNPDTLDMYGLPVEDAVIHGADVLRLVTRDAEPILELFRGVPRGELTPGAVVVGIENGTGIPGQAAAAAEDLRAAGFTAPADSVGDAGRIDTATTTIRYEPADEAKARLLERYLVAGAELVPTDSGAEDGIVLVTGTDYAGVLSEPRPGDDDSDARSPSPSTSGSGATPAGDPSTTTTTIPVGEVPQTPAGEDC